MEDITTLIGNFGFPIFAYIMMFKQQNGFINTLGEVVVTLKAIETRLSLLENKGE